MNVKSLGSKTQSTLYGLQDAQKWKAFERVSEEADFPGAKLVLINEEYYQKALDFIRHHFIPNEPLHKGFGVVWNREQEDYFMSCFKWHLSLMLIDADTADVIALRINRLMHRDDPVDICTSEDENYQNYKLYMDFCDKQSNFFDYYGTDELVHFTALGVSERYARRGIAAKLFEIAIRFIKFLGFESVFIKGDPSSNYSNKLYERCGFELLCDEPYKDFVIKHQVHFNDTGEHQSMKVYGLKVTQ